jgi:adenosine deaminase
MSLQSFVQALPKVELGLQFEGCVSVEAWRNVADLNEVNLLQRSMRPWVAALEHPDVARLDELYAVISQWAKYPEDLIRMVYDIGVGLSKQNVKYAEIGITPTRYISGETTFEELMEALSDGRDRAKRGWGIELAWVFNIPRDEMRRADEIVRLANSTTGRRHNVIGVALVGLENNQQLAAVERAFSSAAKRLVARGARAGDQLGAAGILDAISTLSLTRVQSAWPVGSDAAVCERLAQEGIFLDVPLSMVVPLNHAASLSEYPLRAVLDAGVKVTLTANASARLKTTTQEQYLLAAEACGLEADDLVAIALNGVRASGLSDEQKQELVGAFKAEIDAARAAHLA